jgi:hypothetical protein
MENIKHQIETTYEENYSWGLEMVYWYANHLLAVSSAATGLSLDLFVLTSYNR